jgi:tetratricopeptide (TPR) repeat protein
MGWQLFIGLAALSLVTWVAWKLSQGRNLISKEDFDRLFLTTGILISVALLSGAARWLDAKTPAAISLLVTLVAMGALLYLWLPRIGRAVLSPLTSAYDGGDEEVELKPFYHRANALRKQGKYLDALSEIRSQLEEFPDDTEGMMLEAEVQSDDLKDIPAALGTLTAILATPERQARDQILALSRMADLQLRLDDIGASRSFLQRIVDGWPGTDAARLAQQRILHLPGSEWLATQKESPKIQMGNYEKNLGLKPEGETYREPALASPAQQASMLVNRVTKTPEDWEAREKLAALYARHFKRHDLAKDQMEVLITAPNQPIKAVVHYLNFLADLQLDAPDGATLARETLQRIVTLYPNTPWAELAQSRASRLNLENKSKEPVKTLKIGVYEQNIGLKPTVETPEPPK